MPNVIQSLISFSMLFGFIYVFFIAILGTVIYVILRSRDARGSLHDPQLGIKFAIHLLLTAALLSVVNGAGMIVGDLMSRIVSDTSMTFSPTSRRSPFALGDSAFPSTTMRIGFGMLLAGAILASAEIWFLRSRTNEKKWPATRRMFTGARVLIYGLTVTGLFIGACCAAFIQFDASSEETVKQQFLFSAVGNLAVWTSALAAEMSLLLMFVKQGNTPGENYRCLDCGTDLRGQVTPANSVCPQCGAPTPLAVRRAVAEVEKEASLARPSTHPLGEIPQKDSRHEDGG